MRPAYAQREPGLSLPEELRPELEQQVLRQAEVRRQRQPEPEQLLEPEPEQLTEIVAAANAEKGTRRRAHRSINGDTTVRLSLIMH